MDDFAFACCVALGKSLPLSGLLLHPKGVSSDPLTHGAKWLPRTYWAWLQLLEGNKTEIAAPWGQGYIWAMTKHAQPGPICLSTSVTVGSRRGALSLISSPQDPASQEAELPTSPPFGGPTRDCGPSRAHTLPSCAGRARRSPGLVPAHPPQ